MISTFAAAVLAALGAHRHPGWPTLRNRPPAFFSSRHRVGHEVGLAQYGAYGYALHAATGDPDRRGTTTRHEPGA